MLANYTIDTIAQTEKRLFETDRILKQKIKLDGEKACHRRMTYMWGILINRRQ